MKLMDKLSGIQIRKEFFASLLKQGNGVAAGDVVIPAIVIKDIYKKYQYELTTEEFDTIGDELEAEGLFNWNVDGLLAITAAGIEALSHQKF